jgi:response regulator RpfG family c-di-GMP phosphodiesterase
VLVTAQAGHQDTIKAVNQADLDHYIAKPWSVEDLLQVARKQLTDYVVGEQDNLLPYLQVLGSPRLMAAVQRKRFMSE